MILVNILDGWIINCLIVFVSNNSSFLESVVVIII